MPPNRFNGHTEYGVGIGLRIPHYQHIFEKKPVVDWFEIISENFMVDGGRPLQVLDQILEQYRVVQHGVSMYFGSAEPLNRELCQLLIYLEAPGVVQKSMALFAAAPTLEEQVYYLLYLRNVRTGWTTDERKTYFSWFQRDRSKDRHPPETLKWFSDAGRPYGDGASVKNFMDHIRKDAGAALVRLQPDVPGYRAVAASCRQN